MSNNKIPCEECKALGETKLFSKITAWHLVNAHKEIYPDVKTALKKYKQKFPKAPTVREGYYDFWEKKKAERKPAKIEAKVEAKTKNITDMSDVDQAEWSRKEALRKYNELEERIKQTDDPKEYERLVNLQQRWWKEASPSRSSIESKKEARTITKKEQSEIDKNINFLKSIEDKLDSVAGIDPDVAKFFTPA